MTEVTETTWRFMLDSFGDVDQLRIFLRLSNERVLIYGLVWEEYQDV